MLKNFTAFDIAHPPPWVFSIVNPAGDPDCNFHKEKRRRWGRTFIWILSDP